VALLGALTAAVTALLLNWGEPLARRDLRALVLGVAARGGIIEAGALTPLDKHGARLLFVDRRERHRLQGVLLHDQSNPQRPFTVVAARGDFSFDKSTALAHLRLRGGDVHFEPRAGAAYQRIAFEGLDYTFDMNRLLGGGGPHDPLDPLELTTPEVLEVIGHFERVGHGPPRAHSGLPRYQLEWQRRMALAAAPLLFALAGFPLGAGALRRGKRAHGALLCAALVAAYYLLLQAGDEVVVVEPYYTTYAATFTAGGAGMVAVATQAGDGFMVDPDAVSGALSARTKAVVLNSPNNPSGAVYDAGRVRAVVDICRAHNLWLLSDEVYADLAYAGPVAAPARFMGVEEKLVTVSSVSKSHRMTGWRIGWVVAPRELCRHIANLALCMNYGLPPFVQDAATAALHGGGDAELAELPAIFARRAAVVEAALSTVDAVRVIPPKAGIFMMLQLPAGADAARAAMDLLAAKKIAILPCANFGRGFKRYLRLSLCYDEATLARAAAEIADFFACYDFRPATSRGTSP